MIVLHFYVCLFSPAAAEAETDRKNTRFCRLMWKIICKLWIIVAKSFTVILRVSCGFQKRQPVWQVATQNWARSMQWKRRRAFFCSFDPFYESHSPDFFILTSLVRCLAAVKNIEVAAGGSASGCTSHRLGEKGSRLLPRTMSIYSMKWGVI